MVMISDEYREFIVEIAYRSILIDSLYSLNTKRNNNESKKGKRFNKSLRNIL